jgi:hypothetical protein
MKFDIFKFLLLSLAMCVFSTTKAQEYLQVETINDPLTLKYPLGSTILIKKVDSEDWEKIKLLKFLYPENTIVYDGGFLKLEDIHMVRETRPTVNVLSKMLMTFGGAWLVYGLLSGQLDKDAVSGYADLAIGTSALVVGWGVGKAFYKRDYKMGSRYRLRLIDLRMDSDQSK